MFKLYCKKKIPTECIQWDESVKTRDYLTSKGMGWASNQGHVDTPDLCKNLRIKTLEGCFNVNPGDWIIKGVEGEFWSIRKDIFEKTYEPYKE